jgi:hypothetical protein
MVTLGTVRGTERKPCLPVIVTGRRQGGTVDNETEMINELLTSKFADYVRQALIDEIVEGLAAPDHDDEREWANDVATWLRENYEF